MKLERKLWALQNMHTGHIRTCSQNKSNMPALYDSESAAKRILKASAFYFDKVEDYKIVEVTLSVT